MMRLSTRLRLNVFRWMKDASGLDDTELLRTFNCGVGMVLILDPTNAAEAKQLLLASGEKEVFDLGTLVSGGEIKMVNALS
jgi:phosphoribosylaminoimidazole (AIR) synthetase